MTYDPNLDFAMAQYPHPQQPAHDLTLVALHTAIRFSGLFARFTAQRWGLHLLEDATEQVAVELMARAVETTGNPYPCPRHNELGELHIIGIRVSATDSGLLIEVWDSDPTPPHESYLDDHLSAVEKISQQWSCYPFNSGKVIWAELASHASSTYSG